MDQAVEPENLDPARHLLPPILALGDMPRLTLDVSACMHLAMGQPVKLSTLPSAAPIPPAAELAVLNEQGGLVAIGILMDDGLTFRPGKVFPPG